MRESGVVAEFRSEVERHHTVIESWLCGRQRLDTWARLDRAHHPMFTMITPDGERLDRATTLDMVRGAAGVAAPLRIRITDVTVVHHAQDLVVGSYTESHIMPSASVTRRRATAVLLRDASHPGEWSWRHLHETWLA